MILCLIGRPDIPVALVVLLALTLSSCDLLDREGYDFNGMVDVGTQEVREFARPETYGAVVLWLPDFFNRTGEKNTIPSMSPRCYILASPY